jgi:kynurenine formamidase
VSLIEAIRRAQIFDASPLIWNGTPLFPGHPPVEIDSDARTHDRDGYFLQTLSLGEHTGSHADAPAHALPGPSRQTIDAIPVDRFVAPYLIYDLSGLGLGPGDLASEEDLRQAERTSGHALEPADAALIHFGWERHYLDEGGAWWAANAPGLAADACAYLVDRGAGLVGSDTATCDTAVRDGMIVSDVGHQIYFLPNGIPIVEGLVGLGTVPARGIFVGAPLKVAGGSGAPLRALLIVERELDA